MLQYQRIEHEIQEKPQLKKIYLVHHEGTSFGPLPLEINPCLTEVLQGRIWKVQSMTKTQDEEHANWKPGNGGQPNNTQNQLLLGMGL